MKRALIYSSIILVLAMFYSCKDDWFKDDSSISSTFKNPYSFVGDLHNEGLDSCLNYLSKNVNNIHDKDDLSKYCEEGITKFFIEKKICYDKVIIENTLKKLNIKNKLLSKSSSTSGVFELDFKSLGYNDQQVNYMNRLFNLFNENGITLTTLKDSINKISSQAFTNLDAKNAQPILVTTSVMISSLEYWFTHADELYKIMEQLTGQKLHKVTKEPIDWLVVGMVDAEAIGASAIPCAYLGPALWAECVGAAAVSASMWEATVQLINWFIDFINGNR